MAEKPRRAYLDYNATAPLRPEAREAALAALDIVGNPSSVHAEGRAARAAVEAARRQVAALAGASPRGVIFTASATEAAILALSPDMRAGTRAAQRLIVSAGEHPCVLNGHRFPSERVDVTPLTGDGRIDLGALERLLAEGVPALLALQGANNETGVIQPVAEAAALVRAAGGLVVCDAVQLAGRSPLSMAALGADALILSAHKLGGAKGAGALVAAAEDVSFGPPLIRGGGQERGLRAGTEAVAAIAAFGAAAGAAQAEAQGAAEPARLAALRDDLEAALERVAPDAQVFGRAAPRLPNTSCFAIPGLEAATLVMAFDLAGLAVSSGAACSSGKVTRSAVLAAMGVAPDLAGGAIRLSLGWSSTPADVGRFGEALEALLKRMRGRAA